MKKITTLFPIMIGVLLIWVSCEKIDKPYLEKTNAVDTSSTPDSSIFTDTTAKPRIVLLEDYTGHKCGNCPMAGDAARDLKNLYGEQLVVVAIHAGGFAKASGTVFNYDFKTTAGTELDVHFGISAIGNPNGMVNRIGYPGAQVKPYTTWGSLISTELSRPVQANIFLVNEYSDSTRTVTIHTKTKWLEAITGDYKISVYLVEDSLIHPQLDYRLSPNDTIMNYVHRHVLRGTANGTFGDALTTPVLNGSVEKTFSMTLDPSWDANHCEVVVFVYNATSYEVIQAAEKKVKE